MKNCPYCAEQIEDAAKKCKHCGEYLDPAMRNAAGSDVANQMAIEAARKKAGEALTYAIVGIFCFGIILGPAAIIKGGSANSTLASLGQPTDGRATAGRIIGIIVTVLWVIGIIIQVAGAAAR